MGDCRSGRRFRHSSGTDLRRSREPEALDTLTETISAYVGEYGKPGVTVADDAHPSSQTELGFVCIRIDYDRFVLEGGLVFRTWDELGLKVWEYRSGMEGCTAEGTHTTTTLPPVPTS